MRNDREATSAFSEYFGFDGRTVAVFMGLVLGVVVVVTAIYVAIFGFDYWKTSMNRAGSMMLAGFNQTTPGVAPAAPVSPGVAQAVPQAVPQATQQQGAQYACPTCGAVGLPSWNATGTPTCPTCGALMAIAGNMQNPLNLAAAP